MHTNIMAAGSRDRPPLLAPGRYPQWRSRFIRYVDTRPNGEALRKCILSVPEHTTVETPMNMSPENKAHFLAEKEAIHLILTGIGDEIYSTIDACQTAQEMWEAIKRENVGSKGVPQSGIQCFNYKEYGHFAKECRKPKKLADTDEEVDEQELEAQYRYKTMLDIMCLPTIYNILSNESISNTCLVETDDSNVTPDSPNMCEDDIHNEQNNVDSDDERVALANLIANLKLDVDENKKTQKQLKKANTTLSQELKECKAILVETSKSLGESISVRDSFLVALQTKQAEFEKFKAFNNCTIDYDKFKRKLNEALGQLAQKDTVLKEGVKKGLIDEHKHDLHLNWKIKILFFLALVAAGHPTPN
nr:hypothetical protein [Tanacetum cinerariifolium]